MAAAAMPITTSCPITRAMERDVSAMDSATASGSICSSRSTAWIRSLVSIVDFGSMGRANEPAGVGGCPSERVGAAG